MGYAGMHFAVKDSLSATELLIHIFLWITVVLIGLILIVPIILITLIVLAVRWRMAVVARRQAQPLGSDSDQETQAPSRLPTIEPSRIASVPVTFEGVNSTTKVHNPPAQPKPGETQEEFAARLIAEAKARGFVFYTQR